MKQSVIGRFCEHLLEAGWLLALITAPLFFNVYSDRVFEPDKISLVRSIALVMAAAWLVKTFDGLLHAGRPSSAEGETAGPSGLAGLWDRLRATPLALPTLALVIAYIISTIFSLVPYTSLWGSYQRLQGTYSTFSYIFIFLMVLTHLRRREQVDRFINTVVLTSLPIAIYGILQHYQRDPLPWGGDVTTRVASNMGNAIFVAAYLLMAFFLTLERLIRSFALLMDEEKGSLAHAVQTGAYMAVLVAQLLTIFFTQSRGPWLGLLAGLYVFVLLGLIALRQRHPDTSPIRADEVARAAGTALVTLPVGGLPAFGLLAIMRRGQRWLWLSWLMQALFGLAFLVVFNLPHSPLAPLRSWPYIGRLGQVFEMESGTGRVRTLIWEGVVDLLGRDAGRTIIGYGPESMWVAYNQVYPPELAHYEARNASPDRSHNETFDALVTTGVIGFLAYIFLFGSIFYYGMKWLGLLEGPAQRRLFIGASLAGAVAGVLIPWLVERSWRLAGVGLAAGFILGIIAYLTWAAAAPRHRATGEALPAGQRLLLIALLAAIVGHFVEIHFGIAIASTRVHFWALAGLLVALHRHRIPLEASVPAPAPAPASAKRKGGKQPPARPAEPPSSGHIYVIAFSLIAALILVICGYDYITNQAGDYSPLTIIARSLTAIVRGPAQFETSYGILGLFVLTWLVGGMLSVAGGLTLHRDLSRGPSTRWLTYALEYLVITAVLCIPLIVWHAGRLVPYAADPANHIIVPYTAVFLVMFLLATALLFEAKEASPNLAWGKYSAVSALAGLVLFPLAFLALVNTNMNVIQADVYFKQGKRAESLQQWDASIAYYQKAIDLTPRQDYYYLFLGRAQLQKAENLTDPAARDSLITQSLETLQTAQRLNPLNTDHTANLGRLYRLWAQMTEDPAKRQERFEQSLRYYEQATRLSPHNAGLFNEWGLVYYYMGRYDEAMQKYQQSLALDSEFSQTYLLMGDVYLAWEQWDKAVEAYRQALALEPELVQAHSALGYAYARMGRVQEAIQENLYVVSIAPEDYISLRNLALLYQQVGDITRSLEYAERALPLAPAQERDPLQQLIQQLRQSLGG